jgi:hypothetical protein
VADPVTHGGFDIYAFSVTGELKATTLKPIIVSRRVTSEVTALAGRTSTRLLSGVLVSARGVDTAVDREHSGT